MSADYPALNLLVEDNATAAAFARLCDDEPISEQLKSNTMMLLALSGLEAHNIQLGSGKFNDVMRQVIRAKRPANELNCAEKLKDARKRLNVTQQALHDIRQ